MKRLLIILIACGLLGCAHTPMNVIMTNPATGQSVYISHYAYGFGFGLMAAAITAEQQQKLAIEAARMMGYTEMRVVGGKDPIPKPSALGGYDLLRKMEQEQRDLAKIKAVR